MENTETALSANICELVPTASVKIIAQNVSKNSLLRKTLDKDSIGSSCIGTVCGLSKWKTPLEEWSKRIAGPEEGTDDGDTDVMWFGRELEPVIGKYIEKRQGLKLIRPDVVFTNDRYPGCHATPDFIIDAPGTEWHRTIIETKTSGWWNGDEWGEEWWQPGAVPDLAQLQATWQMGILGLKRAVVVCMFSPRDVRAVVLDFDETLFNLAMERAQKFLFCVREKLPPPIIKGQDVALAAELTGATTSTTELDATGDQATLEALAEYDAAQGIYKEVSAKVKEADEARKAAQAKLILLGKGASIVRCGERTVKITKRERTEYQVKATSWVEVRVK